VIRRLIRWLEKRRARRIAREARIDPNGKCPWCGNFGFVLKAGLYAVNPKAQAIAEPLVRMTCKTCSGDCYEKTVAAPELFLKK
jgi:hypothetical protein